jgi:hypothetical protein
MQHEVSHVACRFLITTDNQEEEYDLSERSSTRSRAWRYSPRFEASEPRSARRYQTDDGTWAVPPVGAALVLVGILEWMFLTSGTPGPISTTSARVETPNTTTPGTTPRTTRYVANPLLNLPATGTE